LPVKFARPSRSLSSPNLAMVFSGVSLIFVIICYLQDTLTNRSKEHNGMQWAVSCCRRILSFLRVWKQLVFICGHRGAVGTFLVCIACSHPSEYTLSDDDASKTSFNGPSLNLE